MIYLSRKELYALFIESDWWRELSYRKRSSCGFICNRCHKKDHCQAHHTHYPENWFDTTLDDLECICRECHEREHGIVHPVDRYIPQPPPPKSRREFTSINELDMARNNREITRHEYKAWKRRLQTFPRPLLPSGPTGMVRQKQRKKKRKKVAQNWPKEMCWGGGRGLNIYVRHHWVNRGTSSN